MKSLFVMILFLFTFRGVEAAPMHHAKHNMLIFGGDQIFASHIVYKQPHNFQVILEIEFSQEIRSLYLRAKREFPDDSFILLLDPIDISKISQAKKLVGELSREDKAGNKIVLDQHVTVDRFKIRYFDELPLSLSATE